MKVIIAGSRNGATRADIDLAVSLSGFDITEVVSGGARGVDRLGEDWAADNGVPVTRFVAEWSKRGKSAGPVRNDAMARYADALIAVWNGRSRGTANMIWRANTEGLPVFVHMVTL